MSHHVDQPVELLNYLASQYPEARKTTLRQWLKHGAVEVNDRPVTNTRHPLQPGDQVAVRSRHEARAEDRLPHGLSIAYEDDWLIVVEKPANLLSMASDKEREKTVYAMLTNYVRRGQEHSPYRVWIVHRLDRETSGLMVLAKSAGAKHALQADWAQSEKRYLAVVDGGPMQESGVFRSHLVEEDPHKVHSARRSENTRLAVTHWRVVKRAQGATLLELTLETGRRHQIRVQLADAGLPVLGDSRYQRRRRRTARRLALHASLLSFRHPVTGEQLTFTSPLPGELARMV